MSRASRGEFLSAEQLGAVAGGGLPPAPDRDGSARRGSGLGGRRESVPGVEEQMRIGEGAEQGVVDARDRARAHQPGRSAVPPDFARNHTLTGKTGFATLSAHRLAFSVLFEN